MLQVPTKMAGNGPVSEISVLSKSSTKCELKVECLRLADLIKACVPSFFAISSKPLPY